MNTPQFIAPWEHSPKPDQPPLRWAVRKDRDKSQHGTILHNTTRRACVPHWKTPGNPTKG